MSPDLEEDFLRQRSTTRETLKGVGKLERGDLLAALRHVARQPESTLLRLPGLPSGWRGAGRLVMAPIAMPMPPMVDPTDSRPPRVPDKGVQLP
ncbi:hypothetical protein ABT317_38280 [Streptomyces carpinensis]|uniref:Uncharacterized protein n=1 Tax=Streptomyces carpinensis TaxID=66369 RepID=A0ABV1WG70_9ACTN